MTQIENDQPLVLILEDCDEDFDTAKESFLNSGLVGELARTTTGDECLDALNCLASSGRLPRLVLLDLNTPAGDGRDALCAIKNEAEWKHIPVVVLTTSSNPKDQQSCESAGADGYYVKPFAFPEHRALLVRLFERWLGLPAAEYRSEDSP